MLDQSCVEKDLSFFLRKNGILDAKVITHANKKNSVKHYEIQI